MEQTVYIETSFFSFYYEQRADAAAVAMRDWTRQWWSQHRQEFVVSTSTAVLAELEVGNMPHREEAYSLATTLPVVPAGDEIGEIVDVYIQHHVMPSDPLGDALHLALDSFYKFDYLLTWNCQHLANANKVGHIRRINALLGLHVPILTTPLELMGDEL